MSFFSGDAQPVVYDYEGDDGRLLDDNNDELNDETFGVDSVTKDFDFGATAAQVGGAQPGQEQPSAGRTGGPRLEPLAELWGQNPQQAGLQPGQQPGQLGRPMTLQELEQQMIQSLHLGFQQVPQGMPRMPPGMGQMPPGVPHGMPQGIPQGVPPGAQGMPQGMPQGFQGMAPPGMMPWYGYQGGQHGQAQLQQFQGQYPPQFAGQMPYGMAPPGVAHDQQSIPEHYNQPEQYQGNQVDTATNGAQQELTAQQETPKLATSQKTAPKETAPKETASAKKEVAPEPYKLTRGHVQHSATSFEENRDALLAQSTAEREKQQARDRKKMEQNRFSGLMGDWDKNFILRNQLQQLISQNPCNDDFYYQVYTAIHGRENSKQPLSDFAQSYLFRGGQRGKRNRDRGDPLQRLQQQVQEAAERVAERAKARAEKGDQPKRTEGSLGQGKNSNAARPRTALSLPETNLEQRKDSSSYDLNYVLRAIEEAYDAVLTIEAHERARPPPDHEDAAAWAAQIPDLQDKLWDALEVQSPLDSNSRQPFIMMLNRDKGKKLIPRVFPHLDQRRRLTILTRIFHQIGDLEVIKNGVYPPDNSSDLDKKTSKSIDLFSNTVLQPLQHFIGELDLNVVVSLFDLLMSSPCGILHICKTRTGQEFITIMVSRAETVTQENTADPATLQAWRQTFDHIFAQLQPHLCDLFPPRYVENSYVWHFSACLALAATLDHQRLLVDAVRDRIFGTMAEAKSLPAEVGMAKISNLNLFLNVMGLNASFDDISELGS